MSNLLGKIPVSRFTQMIPAPEEIREGNFDVVLIGGGMRIQLRKGATPKGITDKMVCFGIGSALADKDWEISFDAFPNLQVSIYRHRGRPPKDLNRARIRGERAKGEHWPEVTKKVGTLSIDAARHYRDRDTTRLKGKVRGETESTGSGPRKVSKTSGN